MVAKVHLVEDEQSITTLVEYNLVKEGFKVATSNNGEEAIKEIKDNEPDIILLDWMLPDLSGLEICKVLKKDLKFKDCLLYTSPSPRDRTRSRMPSSA